MEHLTEMDDLCHQDRLQILFSDSKETLNSLSYQHNT